jgi:hypothetical protein
MSSFKTPKGTELPFLNLKGKEYLQVAHRLLWFREEHPTWSIKSEIVEITDAFAIMKAIIINDDGSLIQTAHGHEDKKDFNDFIEKAETKAIGRALGMAGYGTQFAPEFDEQHRLVDSPQEPKTAHGSKSAVPSHGTVAAFPLDNDNEPPPHGQPFHDPKGHRTKAGSQVLEKSTMGNPGEYVIRIGEKFYGQRIASIPEDLLLAWVKHIKNNAKTKKETLRGDTKEAIEHAEAYLDKKFGQIPF